MFTPMFSHFMRSHILICLLAFKLFKIKEPSSRITRKTKVAIQSFCFDMVFLVSYGYVMFLEISKTYKVMQFFDQKKNVSHFFKNFYSKSSNHQIFIRKILKRIKKKKHLQNITKIKNRFIYYNDHF
jgi:hypothetical protein